ncbi:NUDIX domain-containing protein [Streptomyces sp. NPDC004284]|uniref:NUDIX domain-containing protein n=1 Tax=Streptomyces sp. NPDC004284 TaxID=3364695 RepID=UPI0036BA3ACF
MSDRSDRPRGTLVYLVTPRRELVMMLRDEGGTHCWPGYWAVLGGKPEDGESALMTARRETREEAGVDIPDLTETEVEPYEKGMTPPHVFWALWDGTTADLVKGEEGQALALIPVDDVAGMKVPPHIAHYLPQVLARMAST